MFLKWFLVIILVFTKSILTQITSSSSASDEVEFPLTKSLGFSIKRGLGQNLEDRISREFIEKYEEMKKASQESFENFHVEEKSLRRIIEDEGLDLTKEVDVKPKRRRSSNKLQSIAGKRRQRSQALRREKLNSQSLKSHMHHSKLTNMEFSND